MSEVDPDLKIVGTFHFKSQTRPQKDFWRERFLESMDPTGYTFAEEYVQDGYRKWPDLIKGYGCKAEFDEWHRTLQVKMQAKGIRDLALQKDNFQAAKFLASKGWLETEDKRTKEARRMTEKANEEIKEDMARLGLRLVSSE